jgi:hypothetical protein
MEGKSKSLDNFCRKKDLYGNAYMIIEGFYPSSKNGVHIVRSSKRTM